MILAGNIFQDGGRVKHIKEKQRKQQQAANCEVLGRYWNVI